MGRNESRHVVVIGAGVIGLNSAWHLRKDGHRVTVLDQGDGTRGCSHGNAGLVVPSHFTPLAAPGVMWQGLKWLGRRSSPFSISLMPSLGRLRWLNLFRQSCSSEHAERAAPVLCRLQWRSRDLYLEMQRDLAFTLQTRGLMMVSCTEAGHRHEISLARKAEELGMPTESLTGAQLREREPAYAKGLAGAVFYPGDCHLDPGDFMRRLRQRLEQDGVVFRFGEEVTGWLENRHRVEGVSTEHSLHAADAFVLAGGTASTRLANSLGLRLPLQAGRGFSYTLGLRSSPIETPSILTEARVALTPIGGGLRIGGTMQLGRRDERISSARRQSVIDACCRHLPRFQSRQFREEPLWIGHRPCSPDGLPYLGPLRKHPNVVVATGHGMLGLSLAPASGELVARWLRGGDASVTTERTLDPTRFDPS